MNIAILSEIEMGVEAIEIAKPIDWPINERELRLERICRAMTEYDGNPCWRTKAVITGLCFDYHAVQNPAIGVVRFTKYEAIQLNTLFLFSLVRNIPSLRLFVYEYVSKSIQLQKFLIMARACSDNKPYNVDDIYIAEYHCLAPQLSIYALCVCNKLLNPCTSLAENLIEIIKTNIVSHIGGTLPINVGRACINMITDLSWMRGTIKDRELQFTRDEYKRLFELEIDLIERIGDNPTIRPLKGVLMMQLSNFILKSRNGYNSDYICKYVETAATRSITLSEQVWMRPVEKLNDPNEGRVVKRIVNDVSWSGYDWLKSIDLKDSRHYYVCSFGKGFNNPVLKLYGSSISGFKGDRMVDILSPVAKYEIYKSIDADPTLPDTIISNMGTQVMVMDVLYDEDEAKSELRYLCSLIDMFHLSGEEKHKFFEEIIQYWIYSVKEPENECGRWVDEKERRYVLFFENNDRYHYPEASFDKDFLKIGSAAFMFPDFILGDNNAKDEIIRRIDEKRNAIERAEYLFCHNCLNRDFDIVSSMPGSCPVCGSRDFEIVKRKL